MTTIADRDGLIQNLDRVVRDTLAYFDGPGRVTRAHVDRWGARDILMHLDRKSTRLNSSHSQISYAVFCLKKKKKMKSIYDLVNRRTSCTFLVFLDVCLMPPNLDTAILVSCLLSLRVCSSVCICYALCNVA